MASQYLHHNKPEDEAPPVQGKQHDTDQPEDPEKEDTDVAVIEEASTVEGRPEELNGAAKPEEINEQKGDPEILESAVEQGTAANDNSEDKTVDKKGEVSAEEEGSEEPQTDTKKDKRTSAKSRKKSAEKIGLKHPVTPTIERPARERKIVERYSAPSPGRLGRSSASKVLSIEKGRGSSLKDIPNVAFKLSKRKADDNLQLLHTILFGKKAKAQTLKRNISQFSGYVWIDNEEKHRSRVKEKLEKCVKEKLVDFCDVLNIPINKTTVKKEELSAKLLEFLESPHATTDVLLADKEQKGRKRRRASSGRVVGSGDSAEVPAKKQNSQPTKKRKQSPVAEEEEDDRVETSNEKDDSLDKDGNNDDDVTAWKEENIEQDRSDEDDKTPEPMPSPKNLSKKAGKDDSGSKLVEKSSSKKTAAKSAKGAAKSTKKSSNSASNKIDAGKSAGSPSKPKGTSKKQKVEEKKPVKEISSGKKRTSKARAKVLVEEQGKGKNSKKVKKEPSREEMHDVVVNILKQVDFNTATLSDILSQLGAHFGVDLMHRKAEVKDIITDVINNMSDEDEEEEEEEEEEADDDGDGGDETDKDKDKDEDKDA
ncbi:protein DEK-like isoform X2 [Cucurbita maxima]|uniref:Protein DEK-like isoform X2 n=1 Tax=Cucurbita maxima TaxID=3661 RepID=A0A6J1L0R9_CUCMA|nr:protein DEK-like isoform X2 [Cucurbita maxima]